MAGRKPPPERRPLTPDERAAWDAVARTVRRPVRAPAPCSPAPPAAPVKHLKSDSFLTWAAETVPVSKPSARPAAVLDGSWEKRIRGGALVPDRSVDLHGHSLHAAHILFSRTLAQAVRDDIRLLLVVTGKHRESARGDAGQRGAIAREIGHWIETSPQADRIASVRRAHPRHGGEGALYLILRRRRGT